MRLKLLFLLPFLLAAYIARAQERQVVYQEGFGVSASNGAGSTNVPIEGYSGWDNPEYEYSGSGNVGVTSTHICDLPGSSGKGYVYFSSSSIKDLMIKGIDISGFKELELSYNLKKEQASTGKLLLEIWVDGKKVISTNPTLKTTSKWFTPAVRSIGYTGQTMQLRFTNEETDKTIYLDDLTLTGVPDAPLAPEKPLLTPEAGLYTGPVNLTLSAAADARIYYTLDGTAPSEASTLYQEPFLLEQTATVSAVAVSEGGSSEVTSAHYEIIPVPTVADVAEFREAEERVRLDLSEAEVVDVDQDGVCVQTAQGGLLLPAGVLTTAVGNRLEGFLIGRPELHYGMTGVVEGIYTEVTVRTETMAPVPVSVTVSGLLEQPERYAACLVQLEGVAYHPEDGTVSLVGDESGERLPVRTGSWSQEEDWTWPEKMILKGVLKGDESGFYLWVAAAAQVIASGTHEAPVPVGTALVVTESDGTYYAAKNSVSEESLPCMQVVVADGRAVCLPEKVSSLLWEVDQAKGYLRSPDGKYLQGEESGAALKLSSSYDSSSDRIWKKHPEEGYWYRDQGTTVRALLNRVSVGIKNYAAQYIGAVGYSAKPAVDMPLYAGYVRALTPGRWGTVCVPYAVRAEDCAGALFFEIEGRINDADGVAQALVLSAPVAQLEAGVPYLIYAEASSLAMIYGGEPVDAALGRNGLQGTFVGVNAGQDPSDATLQGKYVLSGNMLRRCAAGSSVGANKAYVDLEKVPVLDRMPEGALRIQVAREETGVSSVPVTESSESLVYSLQGVCLGTWNACRQTLPKGIYILNGTKVIVK